MLHRHPNSTALEEVYTLFLITPVPDDHVKDLNSSQLRNSLLETVRHNLHSVIARIDKQVLNFFEWCGAKNVLVPADNPTESAFMLHRLT